MMLKLEQVITQRAYKKFKYHTLQTVPAWLIFGIEESRMIMLTHNHYRRKK
jgi:hypothetical protein